MFLLNEKKKGKILQTSKCCMSVGFFPSDQIFPILHSANRAAEASRCVAGNKPICAARRRLIVLFETFEEIEMRGCIEPRIPCLAQWISAFDFGSKGRGFNSHVAHVDSLQVWLRFRRDLMGYDLVISQLQIR